MVSVPATWLLAMEGGPDTWGLASQKVADGGGEPQQRVQDFGRKALSSPGWAQWGDPSPFSKMPLD